MSDLQNTNFKYYVYSTGVGIGNAYFMDSEIGIAEGGAGIYIGVPNGGNSRHWTISGVQFDAGSANSRCIVIEQLAGSTNQLQAINIVNNQCKRTALTGFDLPNVNAGGVTIVGNTFWDPANGLGTGGTTVINAGFRSGVITGNTAFYDGDGRYSPYTKLITWTGPSAPNDRTSGTNVCSGRAGGSGVTPAVCEAGTR